MSFFLDLFHLASTYGSGAYNAGNYNGLADTQVTPTPLPNPGPTATPLVDIGPVTLPNTGAGWMVLVGAFILAVAAGWAVWIWRQRRLRQTH